MQHWSRRYPIPPTQANVNNMSPYVRPIAGMSPMAVTPPMPSSMHTPMQSPLPCGPTTNQIPIAANSYVQFQARAGVGAQRINQGMTTPTSVKTNNRRTKGAAKSKTSMISMADAVVDEADEPSGDELDNLKFRDVSMARFKRCHEYIAEIFSPYSISAIIPPESPYQSKNIEELKKQIAETQAEIEKMTSEHSEKMKNFTLRTEALSKSMQEIRKCNYTEELLKIQEKIEKESDFIIEPYDHVTLVQIHNAPDSETDENDQHDMMQDDDDELDEIDEEIDIEDQLINPISSTGEQLGSGSKELQYNLDGSLVGANSNELIDSNNSIEGIVGSGVVDSSEIQGYLNQAGVPGMSGDPNMVGHSPFTSNTILSNEPNYMGDPILNVVETAYQEDSTGLVFDFINADDEVMNDNGDPHLAYNN